MSTAERAKQLYRQEWQASLEAEHQHEFVAIEPISRTYFLGSSFLAAAMLARQAYPGRTPFVIRIGHDAAIDGLRNDDLVLI